MTDTNHETITGCLFSISLLILAPFLALYHGWALWLMWGWFVVPLAPPITWKVAVGLSLFLGFIKMRSTPINKDETTGDKVKSIVTVQLAIIVSVFFGWIFHLIGFGVKP